MLATSSTADPIRAETVRSGLVESIDELTACVVDTSGRTLVAHGEPDRPLYYRSAIKPFQAAVSLELGAELPPEHLAVACSSHAGHPAHLAIVTSILTGADLDESALQTPPDWPLSGRAARLAVARGSTRPRPLFHNCSGKHSAWLAGCVASDLDPGAYLEPEHPLQRRVVERLADVAGLDPEPVGVDGCGAPTLRGSTAALARAFARLGHDDAYAAVRTACSRFPALVAGNDLVNGKLGQWWPGPVKSGAEGLIACAGNGFGAAVKSHSGSYERATAALGELLRVMGVLSAAAADALADVLAPPVLGGGRPRGAIRIVLPSKRTA
jgi:L-asparaginase II